ncbi:MAG: LysR family transcriptional regulator [Pirellulaceae bacterium]
MRYQHNQLQQLRGFYFAARAQSFSKAARELSLTQPSISLQIQALEQDLGVRLFDRKGPRVYLTREGEMLLELAQPLVEGFARLEEEFAARRESVATGEVRVAAGGSTLQYILPVFIKDFVREFPQIDLRLHNVTGKKGLALLRAGEVDVAVGPMLEAPPDIRFQPLQTYDPVLITALGHPLASLPEVTLRDVSRYPLILPPRDQSTYRFVDSAFANESLRYEVKLEVGGYDVIKTYVQLGLGVSIVMSHCLTGDEPLFQSPMNRFFPCRSYGIVLHKARSTSRATQCFVETLCGHAARHRAT